MELTTRSRNLGGGRGGAGLAELAVRGGALGAGAEGRGRAGAGGAEVTRADGSGPGPGAKSAPALGACWKSASGGCRVCCGSEGMGESAKPSCRAGRREAWVIFPSVTRQAYLDQGVRV